MKVVLKGICLYFNGTIYLCQGRGDVNIMARKKNYLGPNQELSPKDIRNMLLKDEIDWDWIVQNISGYKKILRDAVIVEALIAKGTLPDEFDNWTIKKSAYNCTVAYIGLVKNRELYYDRIIEYAKKNKNIELLRSIAFLIPEIRKEEWIKEGLRGLKKRGPKE